MFNCTETVKQIKDGAYDQFWQQLYPQRPVEICRERYIEAVERFISLYGERPVILLSAPGRAEIGGNHTDHQNGRVLAAAVDLDILCVASPLDEAVVRVHSEGHPPVCVELDDLSARESEQGHSAALVRGIAAWLRARGYPVGGFCAYTISDVPSGSGLSSSAAFEVAMGGLFRALYGAPVPDFQLALAGQYAENRYFGKPCGLMDQTASAMGGLTLIDFRTPGAPVIDPIPHEQALRGLRLCVVKTGGSHAELTHEYAAITEEMGRVAAFFGQKVLRDVEEQAFIQSIPRLRASVGDRAVLRAMHFFAENALVPAQAGALARGDATAFLDMVIQSGQSSLSCLQNVFQPAQPEEQGLALALALSEKQLAGRGAWRVHGSGFAGTILAFAPEELQDAYRAEMEAVFGAGACLTVLVRPSGVIAAPI